MDGDGWWLSGSCGQHLTRSSELVDNSERYSDGVIVRI
jgi:hypothetical protein